MRTVTVLLLLAAVGCDAARTNAVNDARQPESAAPGPVDERFRERLLEIAAAYTSYGRVDDLGRWAPFLCSIPPPAQARMSASRDRETHGRKIYSLLARDREAYVSCAERPQPTDQVIVKESWLPEALPAGEPMPEPSRTGEGLGAVPYFHPYAEMDGRVYRATTPGPLFVMFKVGAETPGTDDGWVYGTVDTGGEVTSAGRVESCMGCHADAPHGRLFGPQ